MIELMAGMVAVLALAAGVIVGLVLIRAHGDAMVEAREKVGTLAMMDMGADADLISNAKYIRDWTPGKDSKRMTPDDKNTAADAGAFQDRVVNETVADPDQWDVVDKIANNRLSKLRKDGTVINSFGLVKGQATKIVNMGNVPDWVPRRAYQDLMNPSDVIDVDFEVWLPVTKGVY